MINFWKPLSGTTAVFKDNIYGPLRSHGFMLTDDISSVRNGRTWSRSNVRYATGATSATRQNYVHAEQN